MKKYFEQEKIALLLMVILLIVVQIPTFLLLKQGTVGFLLLGFFVLLLCVTMMLGTVKGLYSSFLFIFIVGTTLFYLEMTNTPKVTFPLPLFLGYGVALIICILLTGRVHDIFINQGEKNRRLQEEIRQFVAVDVETGFDNKFRMEMEVQAEMKRTDRYGAAFTLILLQIDYFAKFKQLYGEKETSHLLSELAKTIEKTMRITDRKFRYDQDRFALLLTNTDDHSVEVIYKKLAETLKTHQLLNEKYVTLSFRSGHIVYDQEVAVADYRALLQQVESEMVYREL